MLHKVEKYLMRIVALCFVAVVVAQGLMTNDATRFYMSWSERMEGQNLPAPVIADKEDLTTASNAEVKSPQALLTIKLNNSKSEASAIIMINGQNRYNFSQAQVTLRVNAGDTVEIDTRDCGVPLEFTVASGSDNLAYPNRGQVFNGNQSIVMIGKIIVK